MNIHLTPRHTREINSGGTVTGAALNYLVDHITAGTSDETVLQQVLAAAPAALGTCTPVRVEVVDHPAPGALEAEVVYEHLTGGDYVKEAKREGDQLWSFEICVGRRHINYAKSSRGYYGTSGLLMPQPGCAINWNGRGDAELDVAGADILAPVMRECCRITMDPDDISNSFRRQILALTGKVNDAAFHGWEAGEVLFLGAEQGKEFKNNSGSWLCDVSYHFAIRCNRTGVTFTSTGTDDPIQVGTVRGWELVWPLSRYLPASSELKVRGVYVSTLYESGNFALLGLGSATSESSTRTRLRRITTQTQGN